MKRAILFLLLIAPACGSQAPDATRLPRYDLAIRLDPADRRLTGHARIELPPTDTARDRLSFALSELFDSVSVRVLEPAGSSGAGALERTNRPYSRPGWGTNTWTVTPRIPIAAGTPVVLDVRWAGAGERTSFIFSLGGRTSFGAGIATAWYPEIEEPVPSPSGRLRGLRATGTLDFSVPAGHSVYAEGQPRSAPSGSQGEAASYRFDVDRPAFFSFAAGPYLSRSVDGRVPTAAFVLRDRPQLDDYIRRSMKIVDILSAEFGPYPFDRFAVVEVEPEQAGNAGFAGASVDGFIMATTDFLDREYNTAYYGHEIGHQWWGGVIRPVSQEGSWVLSEAMASYGGLRAIEALEGEAAAAVFRADIYPGFFNYGGGMYYRLAAAGLDLPLKDLPAEGTLPRMLANSKGLVVWDMLSRELGRERFGQVMARVVAEYGYRRVAWPEFVDAVSRAAGRDMSWFFEQWFSRTGAPQFEASVGRDSTGGVATIYQRESPYRVTLTLAPVGRGCGGFRRAVIAGLSTRIPLQGRCTLDSVVVDSEDAVLQWTESRRRENAALAPYTRADLAFNSGPPQEAATLARAALDSLARAPRAQQADARAVGLPFLLHLLVAQAELEENNTGAARIALDSALSQPARREGELPLAYLLMARLARARNDTTAMNDALRRAVQADEAVGRRHRAADEAARIRRGPP